MKRGFSTILLVIALVAVAAVGYFATNTKNGQPGQAIKPTTEVLNEESVVIKPEEVKSHESDTNTQELNEEDTKSLSSEEDVTPKGTLIGPVTPSPGLPASLHTAEKVFLMGGFNHANALPTETSTRNNVITSTNGVNWSVLTQHANWSPRIGHTSLFWNSKLWLFGGISSPVTKEVWSSNNGSSWSLVTANAPWGERGEHETVIFNNKIFLLGGTNNGNYNFYNDVWSSTNGSTWTQVTANAPWGARADFTATVFNNKIFVIGGMRLSPYTLYGDVWSSTDGITWMPVTTNLPNNFSRFGHTSLVFGGKIWVLGGRIGNDLSAGDVWSSSDGATWTQIANNISWMPNQHTSFLMNGKMWIAGGHMKLGQTFFPATDARSSSDGINWTQTTTNIIDIGSYEVTSAITPDTFGASSIPATR